MCGILGTPKFTDDTALMLPMVAFGMVSRGKDAWGATDGTSIIKHLGPLQLSWKYDYVNKLTDWTSCIIHTRSASGGTGRKTENAHPFEFTGPDGLHVVGIHNGYIINHVNLGNEYARKYDVDSEHIWMHRSERRSWAELQGYGNLAWYENMPGEQPVQYVYRSNTDDLSVIQTGDGGIIFASENEILKLAADLYGIDIAYTYHVPENVICRLTPEGLQQTDEHVEFFQFSGVADAKRGEFLGSTPIYPGNSGSTLTSLKDGGAVKLPLVSSGTGPGFCYKCWHKIIERENELLCSTCYNRYYTLWKYTQESSKALSKLADRAVVASVLVN